MYKCWTHREMIPGGKLLGIALVSTQKALSLVQEQVPGQRGILGALLASDSPGRQRHRHTADRQIIHLCPSSSILRQEGSEAVWMSFLKFLLSGLLRGDGEPAYNPSSCDNAERRVEPERERKEGREGVRVVLCVLGGCGCSAASLDLCDLSLCFSQELLPDCRDDELGCFLRTRTCRQRR